jgi:undecaprenyl diphosphate synthase
MQSTLEYQNGLHAAIIMDGNGRWARARGLPRTAGHRAGVAALQRVCEAAPACGVGTLSVFAFSSDNWRRPAGEVSALMGLLRNYLRTEVARLVENDTRLTVIGRRDRLPDGLEGEIAAAEARTMSGRRLHVRVAIDYSARDAMLRAVTACVLEHVSKSLPSGLTRGWGPLLRKRTCATRVRDMEQDDESRRIHPAPGIELTREALARLITGEGDPAHCDVDLLIRSGGEKRLSDFLLWECAYAELFFTDRMWPDFGGEDLAAAVNDFRQRERRFGALEHVPQKGEPLLRTRTCANEGIEQDDDSKKSHSALGKQGRPPPVPSAA